MEKKSPVDIPVTKEMLIPNHPSLTQEQTTEAMKELIRNYPAITRHGTDPSITRQEIGLVSFMLLKEPKDGIYGFIKLRGNYEDVEAATKKSEDIIKNVDSVFPIHQLNVGFWHPITNNEKYTQDRLDVKTNENEIMLRDRAAKENEAKNQRQRKEIENQKEEVKNVDIDSDKDSLDYYTKKRVSQKNLNAYVNQAYEKIKTLKKSLKGVNKEILELNKAHPSYVNHWLENYNKVRVKSGIEPMTEEEIDKIPILGSMN